ncbi:MAG: hypothetical protein DRQ39_09465 [Gammaproteobacteria bacterium]|nr:MAG: hypothetical protein DRQ39_09465 [Gammaproteobacteria bacterium]
MNKTYALDTETGPYPMAPGDIGAWALEPYRPEFYVKMLGIAGPDGYGKTIHMSGDNFDNDFETEIEFLSGHEVVCHNAIFDIAVCMRKLGLDHPAIAGIKWRDTSLLAKWLNNSQDSERFRYSLRNCVEKWLPDSNEKEEFLAIKDNIQDDYSYWLTRVVKDCNLTLELHEILANLLPAPQWQGYIIECKCLYPLAKGWMTGIEVDPDVVYEARITYQAKANKILRDLNIKEPVLRSPVKLGKLLFEEWGLEPISHTATGKPSTCADDLKMIGARSEDPRILKLLEAKQALTVISKYVNGFDKSIAYLNDTRIHPNPRLFNGYTGRMSYSSKLMKKFQVGIALHQLPRKAKLIKHALIAPAGSKFLYMDFAAQELRIMAQFSHDKNMLDAFNAGKDLHAVMTESIYGTSYETIVAGNTDGIPEIVDQRNCGKLTNLSSMYRIGAKSLQAKFFTQYDKLINLREATHFLNSYKKAFRGIPAYWQSAINIAKHTGYATSLSNRQFKLKATDWKGESSAINFPIQGSGADLSELAIALISERFPEMTFLIQVHDSLTWQIPDDMNPLTVKIFIDNISWNKYFQTELKINFPLDFAYGESLGNLEAL